MKHATLKDSVGALKRYRPRVNYVPGQLFPDLVGGERGREPIISTIQFHLESPSLHEKGGSALSSSTGAPSVSSSAVDAAKTVYNPTQSSVRTFLSQYTEVSARGDCPHFATPFDHLFSHYIEHRHAEVRSLLEHPDAPSPAEFLERVCAVAYPDFRCVRDVVVAELERRDRKVGLGAVRIWELYQRCEHLQGPLNDATYELVDLMIRALVSVSAVDSVVDALNRVPNDFIRPQTWDLLLVEIAKRKIRSAEILWRLVGPQSFAVTSSGQFGLSAEFATILLTRTTMAGHSCAPLIAAKAIMSRYFEFCAATEVPLHPTPFLFFFKLIRDARSGTESTLFHWQIVWEYYQKLNTECPQWYDKFPEEAKQLCCFLIDIMIKGADPWMVLNVSRSIAIRRIVDGFELSLRILRRLEPFEHHPAETKAVARKLFNWLVDTVQIHRLPAYHRQLVPAMQVLLRLGMLSEISKFQNRILECVTILPEHVKVEFVNAFSDVLCLSCHSLMGSTDTSVDRQCPYCQSIKPARVDAHGAHAMAGNASASGSASASANLILLTAVAELSGAAVASHGNDDSTPSSILNEDIIDISHATAELEREKKTNRDVAAAAVVAASELKARASAAVSSSSSSIPEEKIHLRRASTPVVDALPDQGTPKTAAQHSRAREQHIEEGKVLKNILDKLQKDQPTRKELRDRSSSAEASIHKNNNSTNTSFSASVQTAKKTSAYGADHGEAEAFVPAVEADVEANTAAGKRKDSRSGSAGKKSSKSKSRSFSEENHGDVRAVLEDATNREVLQQKVRLMALQGGAGMGGSAESVSGVDGEGDATDGLGGGMHFSAEGLSQPEAALPPFVSEASGSSAKSSRLRRRTAASEAARQQKKKATKGDEKSHQPLEYSRPPTPETWTCVWCQEQHASSTTTRQCAACGAETGPDAAWREFIYATPESVTAPTNSSDGHSLALSDPLEARMVMEEIRHRILHCYENPEDGVVAAYYLMVYRKLFLMRAKSSDFALVEQLVAALASNHERVLAGYVYSRLVPAALRRLNTPALQRLAVLFGTSTTKAFTNITVEDLRSDGAVCIKVFGSSTCRVCFGSHDWRVCPIVTRDFRTMLTRVRLTPEEQDKGFMEGISRATRHAAELAGLLPTPTLSKEAREKGSSDGADEQRLPAPAAEVSRAVVSAYKLFLTFRLREEWAAKHPKEANLLSQLLSREGSSEMLRSSFVLCHIPLHARENASYLQVVQHFGLTKDDAEEVLSRRSPLYVFDNSHPNFVQVTLTCCICLEGKHASFSCPNITQWLRSAERTMKSIRDARLERVGTQRSAKISSSSDQPKGSALRTTKGGKGKPATRNSTNETETDEDFNPFFTHGAELQQLRALVNGWTFSGPERLIAFYRFLLTNIDSLSAIYEASQPFSPIRYAINTTICRLVETGHSSNAWRLFARTPIPLLDVQQSVSAILKMNGVSEENVARIISRPDHVSTWLKESSLPVYTHCLICFDKSHSFHQCPELAARGASVAERVKAVVTNVGGIKCTRVGANAAADYVFDTYRQGELSKGHIRRDVDLAKAIANLAQLCFAGSEVFRGKRLLRILPAEMTEPELLDVFWRAAGLSENSRDRMADSLNDFYKEHSFMPRMDAPPSFPRKPLFNQDFRRVTEKGLCRRCGESSHSLESCPLYTNEACFAKDIISVFRVSLMTDREMMPNIVLKVVLMRIAKFVILYHRHLPYEYRGVQNAVNSTAGFLAMMGELGVALRLLLAIPAAYRQLHGFAHILRACGFSVSDVDAKLENFDITGDARHDDTHTEYLGALSERPPIPDVALSQIFSSIPNLMAALRVADEVVLSHTDPDIIRRENEMRSRMLTSGGLSIPSSSNNGQYANEANDLYAVGDALSRIPPLTIRAVQFADVLEYRSAFTNSIQTPVEKAIGRSIGSNHPVYHVVEEIDAPQRNREATVTAVSAADNGRKEEKDEDDETDEEDEIDEEEETEEGEDEDDEAAFTTEEQSRTSRIPPPTASSNDRTGASYEHRNSNGSTTRTDGVPNDDTRTTQQYNKYGHRRDYAHGDGRRQDDRRESAHTNTSTRHRTNSGDSHDRPYSNHANRNSYDRSANSRSDRNYSRSQQQQQEPTGRSGGGGGYQQDRNRLTNSTNTNRREDHRGGTTRRRYDERGRGQGQSHYSSNTREGQSFRE